jgi:hypothetical protein
MKPQKQKRPAVREHAKPGSRSKVPDPATVIATKTFISPKGRRYTILATSQTDPYDDGKAKKKRRPD